jgi:hypothetical protein
MWNSTEALYKWSYERGFRTSIWTSNKRKGKSYPCNMPWRPIGMWDVEAPTFSRQSAHRWRWGCRPKAPGTLYPQEDSWYSFLLEAESTPGPRCGWIRSIEKSNDHIGNRTRDLPVCSIVPQPTTLPRAPELGISFPNSLQVKLLYAFSYNYKSNSVGGSNFKIINTHLTTV